jgi:hypothetical protein
VKAALAFTNNWFTTNRSALGDQLTANFDGQLERSDVILICC